MKRLLCAFAIFATALSVFGQDIVATGTITDDDAGDAGFAARCAIAEALGGKCETFDTSTAVDNYRYNFNYAGESGVGGWDPDSVHSDSALVTWQSGRLRLDENPAGDNPTSWWMNFDPAVTTMSHTNSVDHDEYSVQVEVEVSQARFDFDMGGTGHKTIDFTHANQNGPNQVLQLSYEYNRRYWVIQNTGGGFNDALDYQPGSDFGGCDYVTASDDVPFPGMQTATCYVIQPDEAITFNFHFKFNGDDTADVRASVCVDGVEMDWLSVLDEPLAAAEDGFAGHSAINLINRNEDHDAYTPGSVHPYVYYDNLIVQPGAGSIDCPVPVPSWFTAATPNRWETIPGTSTGTINAVTPGRTDPARYSGMAAYGTKLFFAGGGHAIDSDNSVQVLDISGETAAWAEGSSTSTSDCFAVGATCVSGTGTGAYGDGSRAGDHNYGHMIATSTDKVIFGAIGSGADCPGCSNDTFSSPAAWKWEQSQISNGEKGYTYLTQVHTGGSIRGSYVLTTGCYDEDGQKAWYVNIDGYNSTGVWGISNSTGAVTNVTGYGGGNFAAFCVVLPDFNVLLVGTTSNTLHTMDLASPGTWTTRSKSGGDFQNGNYKYPMVYSPAANQLLGRVDGDGNSIRYCTVPGALSSAFACNTSSAAGGGSTPGDTPSDTDDGPYTRFNIIPNFMDTGDDLLLYLPQSDGPVYFQRISGPRS